MSNHSSAVLYHLARLKMCLSRLARWSPGNVASRPLTAFMIGQLLFAGAIMVRHADADWPQVLGPERNGVAVDSLDALAEQPHQVWQVPAGQGYAGPAVSHNRVFFFHRQADSEIIESLDADTGSTVWRQSFPTRYRGTYNPDSGPRCVPTVAYERVVVMGAGGRLSCLESGSGQVIWTRDTRAEDEAPEGFFGAGSSPLVHDKLVIVNVGGRSNAGIVAFELGTGDIAWSIADELASYASPVVAGTRDQPLLICVTRYHLVVAQLRSGDVVARIPFGARGPTVNAANPIVIDQHVFVTASYGVGSRWIKFGWERAEALWERQDVLSSQYVTPVPHHGILYGIDGRDDVGSTQLKAIDPTVPRVLWSVPDFGMATLIGVGDKVLALKTNGEIVLFACDTQAYRELGRARLTREPVRALPAFAAGRLYLRDSQMLRSFELSPSR